MEIVYFQNEKREVWDDFAARQANDGGFLQSWQWGEFQKSLGKKIWRLGVEDSEGDLLAVCLVIRDNLALRQITLDIPRGPIIKDKRKLEEILKMLISEIKKIGKDEEAMIVRFDFPFFEEEGFQKFLFKLNLKRSDKDLQPQSTLFLDLEKTLEAILKSMKPKHRYNIRLAQKRKVKIKEIGNDFKKAFGEFWELLKITSQRDKFAIHEKNYYFNLLNLYPQVKLYLAEYDRKIIAAAITGFFGRVCVYLHGASANEYRNVMAPYLLHWFIINKAKEQGCKIYDLGGVKSEKNKNNNQLSWKGITRFKRGFAPEKEITEFWGLWEIRIKKVNCFVYRIIRQIVKLKNLFIKKVKY